VSKAEEILKGAFDLGGDEPHLHYKMAVQPIWALICFDSGRVEAAEAQIARCRKIMAGNEDWRGLTDLVLRLMGSDSLLVEHATSVGVGETPVGM
jgi:hypothetical protein